MSNLQHEYRACCFAWLGDDGSSSTVQTALLGKAAYHGHA